MTINEKKDIIRRIMSVGFFSVKEEDNSLVCSTRKHGDIENGTPGNEDLETADLKSIEILDEVPGARVTVDTVDEWTRIIIRF
jgi:hypothetical protein